ncbi:carboxymuconolactone decarboxylase family protein [Pseudoalteromonas sp. DL2-H2.2]|uniref:carboxymuconolactone decarboxylase family protein n=1 Tax=Pseudoalteromonas sp. DL2-H2.2 TaxID=2908889 RepID=UPI001F19FD4D|nr:carboxymuconolactone decarboxylase family protein [Pseudoalteromonas sp. DL2-H2.2]MCF2906894.1 carboxymuconolactone decarboxylase family protein [Pseudoalteromonas sp. DL2-H2.2]
MPLVKPLSQEHDQEVAELAKFFNETLGFCPNSVLTMQIRPAIARAFINLNKAVMENHGRVTSELKRLIGYITSANTGCRYCEAHTILAAQRYGGSDERLATIWQFRESDVFTAAEKAAFEFALAASSVPNAVDASIESAMQAHWDDGEIVEILGVIALFGYLNRWNDSMATTLEPGAIDAGETLLNERWETGKHSSQPAK